MLTKDFLIGAIIIIVLLWLIAEILIRIDRIKRFLPEPRKIHQITVLSVLVCFLILSEYLDNRTASLRETLVSAATSERFISFLALFYFVIKVPTKDDLKKLSEEIKELRTDFKEHMKLYHQK